MQIEASSDLNAGLLDRLISRINGGLTRAVAESAAAIEAEAKRLAPVETGALRDSIRAEVDRFEATITAGEGLPDDRAAFMEFGFNHAGSGGFVQRPFLRPAVERHRGKFFADVRAVLD
jgi:HK97 gp10 family phage protein